MPGIKAGGGLESAPRSARSRLGSVRVHPSGGRLGMPSESQDQKSILWWANSHSIRVQSARAPREAPNRSASSRTRSLLSGVCSLATMCHLTSSFVPGRRRFGAPILHRRDVGRPGCQTMRYGIFRLRQAER